MEHVRIDLAHQSPFLLGDVEIRPATREVIRGSRSEVVEPRVMQVLVALARSPGEILTRGDLTMQCWEGRIVGEDAINRVISRVRSVARALGGFRVETVNKVGYRVVEADDAGEAQRRSDARRTTIDRRMLIGGGAAALAAVAGGAWFIGQPGAPSSEVEELIRRGKEASRVGQADQVAQGVALLRLATAREPENAKAWGALALAYNASAFIVGGDEVAATRERARAAARRALEIDADNADAAAALALSVRMQRNWAEAERVLRRTLARHRDHPSLLGKLAMLMAETGRHQEALPLTARLIEVEPFTVGNHYGHAHSLWAVGRIDEAEQTLERALERWPRYYSIWFLKTHLLTYTGRAAQAIDFAEDVGGRPIGIPEDNFAMTIAAARAMQTRAPADVQAGLGMNMQAAARGTGFAQNAAILAAALGRRDDAFRVLDGYFFNRGMSVPDTRFGREQGRSVPRGMRPLGFLFIQPMRPLWRDPRFEPLMRQVGLDAYWRAERIVPDYRLA